MHQQLGRPHLGVSPGDRELNALVLAYGAAEYVPLFGVRNRLCREPLGIADAFGGNQQPLGIHSVQDVTKPPPLFADQVLRRHHHIIEEHLACVMIHHGADGSNRKAMPQRSLHIHDEGRKTLSFLPHLLLRGGARQ